MLLLQLQAYCDMYKLELTRMAGGSCEKRGRANASWPGQGPLSLSGQNARVCGHVLCEGQEVGHECREVICCAIRVCLAACSTVFECNDLE